MRFCWGFLGFVGGKFWGGNGKMRGSLHCGGKNAAFGRDDEGTEISQEQATASATAGARAVVGAISRCSSG
jgi:hypothetical protein